MYKRQTLSRTIPKILHAVEGSQINETSVEIKWVVSEKNPVDGLAIWEEAVSYTHLNAASGERGCFGQPG